MVIGINGEGTMALILVGKLQEQGIEYYYLNELENFNNIDVIIDFSHPSRLEKLAQECLEYKIPVVICTTGYTSEDEAIINNLSSCVPVLYTKNTSLGVTLLKHLVKESTKVLLGYDIEIIEKHHNQKIDAPSGSAQILFDEIKKIKTDSKAVYERESIRASRNEEEVGIHSIRGGSIVGEHSVLFINEGEIIELKHSAISKDLFALGAIRCATYLVAQDSPLLYTMEDVLNLKEKEEIK
ncbi:MAG: 4-hydroxy-tetrahydrodipicolinate reductase [Bacilli bacterium]